MRASRFFRTEVIRVVRYIRMLPVFLIPVVALILGTAVPDIWAYHDEEVQDTAIPFDDAEVFFEINATDGDIGFHAFFDGEAWEKAVIVSPDGKIFSVQGKGNLKEIGLTELRFESEEPSFNDLPLEEFLDMFPEGVYKFFGKTVDGTWLVGTAMLTHLIPDAPTIVSPEEGEVVNPEVTFIDWDPVTTGRSEIEVVGYQVVVEREDPLRVFSVDLPPSTTEVQVSPEFLEPGTEYKCGVTVIEASGNRVATESFFETEAGE